MPGSPTAGTSSSTMRSRPLAASSARTSAQLDADLQPGVVHHPKGLWAHNTDNGRTSNALTPATYTDLGAGACFNDARVQVERVP